MQNENSEKRVDRRTFLTYLNFALGGFISVALGIPLVGSLVLPTLKQREAIWSPAGPIGDYPLGQPKAATVTVTIRDGWIERQEAKGIWVVRNSQEGFTVLNGRCVHLGCAYSWVESQKEFLCPCHAGRYSLDGKVLSGPPPRPLDNLEWRVEGGNLMVRYQDFRLGIPQKEVA